MTDLYAEPNVSPIQLDVSLRPTQTLILTFSHQQLKTTHHSRSTLLTFMKRLEGRTFFSVKSEHVRIIEKKHGVL